MKETAVFISDELHQAMEAACTRRGLSVAETVTAMCQLYAEHAAGPLTGTDFPTKWAEFVVKKIEKNRTKNHPHRKLQRVTKL